ncbi:hypothetical protein Trydic_g4882 [Trypoxylus dichotomus]
MECFAMAGGGGCACVGVREYLYVRVSSATRERFGGAVTFASQSECGECGLPADRRKVKTHLDGVDDPGNMEVGRVISQQLNFNAARDKIWYCKVALRIFYDGDVLRDRLLKYHH